MSEYNFKEIERKWQKIWKEKQIFKASNNSTKPKYYALDMFPYPSGAGLHVGHPLGYIASDIIARYKRTKGFNVLHPMGFDSFGLPAEQYAVQTGQHPAITTEQNIARYIQQLEKIGFSFDWNREIWTSKPDYYQWTQWIFIQLFHGWYNKETNKAEHINILIQTFETSGNSTVKAACDDDVTTFSAEQWKNMSDKEKSDVLLKYRLTYLAETMVNWCPALGTVLANEEVVNGVSERGGYPVERKKMQQWMMRITAYAERLLQGLDTLDWPEPMKDMQKYWIGKSFGAELTFEVVPHPNAPHEGKATEPLKLTVFTTRIDTTFGVTYVSIAPEHELIPQLTAPEYKEAVEKYITQAKNRSERDRMSDVKTVSGQFTGSYVINPFNGEKIQLWIADYVLAGYGTGVVMAVPSSDERDFKFATHYNLPIIPVQEGTRTDITKEDFDPKAGKMVNSGFLNGLTVTEAIQKAIKFAEEKGVGKARIQYKMRDAIFARQRYWGEPIPIYYKNGIPQTIDEIDLPLELPQINEYKPTETGEPPLGRAKNFTYKGYPLELSTMPGWAGSSWYFLRYMDPKNITRFVSEKAEKYWNQVDLYIGGAEHATGHLFYSRFWNMFLYDLGLVTSPEPFKKLINQGMIQGRSNMVKAKGNELVISSDKFDSYIKENNLNEADFRDAYIDVRYVNQSDAITVENLIIARPDFKDAKIIEAHNHPGQINCYHLVEKMSKSKYNVVNPDEICDEYGADTLRMYEMFLGPLEQFKPWNTAGIEGVYKFLRKLWRLFYNEQGKLLVTDNTPTPEELKILHKTIKKVEEDIERHSFNTSVSTFMVCVNELSTLKCSSKSVLEELLIVLSPYAPHITEELWSVLGHTESISFAGYPQWKQEYMTESEFEYPISINGKMRAKINFPLDMPAADIEKQVLANEIIQKWLEGKDPKKIIVVPNKIVNVVL
ncbi:MAG TPA: leucine--tRNA ligase [Cytophagaceae bacterium]|jgi:leucyl-tRNA synthetase|nr:leucine--tRNA ligase [Cytophagaceae bacterium]